MFDSLGGVTKDVLACRRHAAVMPACSASLEGNSVGKYHCKAPCSHGGSPPNGGSQSIGVIGDVASETGLEPNAFVAVTVQV